MPLLDLPVSIVLPHYKPVLKPETPEKIGRVLYEAYELQARQGLAPAKKGGVVTLHEVANGAIWQEYTVLPDGTILFTHAQAWLLEQYNALELRPEWQAWADQQIQSILENGIDVVEA